MPPSALLPRLAAVLLSFSLLPAAEITGTVLDASTREPISKASIREIQSLSSTTTSPDGRFRLDLPATATIQVTCTGYRAFRLTLSPNTSQLEILLIPDTLRRNEKLTVSAGPFEAETQNALSLAGHELRNLASVLADDPLRAVQGLPGVAPNDDFQSQIVLRGASPNRTGIYLDGVLLHSPFHTMQADPTSASLTVLSSDLLERVELFPSNPPAAFADRTVGVLDMRLRDGDRKKFSGRASASASNASVSLEAPFAKGRGSWLIAARKSYLQYIINTTSDEPSLAFGFWDIQGRAAFDLTARHQLSLTAIHGSSALDRSGAEASLGLNAFFDTSYTTTLLKLGSRYSPSPRWLVQHNAALLREAYSNLNRQRAPLAAGYYGEWILNSDNSFQYAETASLHFGATFRRLRDDGFLDRRQTAAPFAIRIDQYRGTGLRSGAHLANEWRPLSARLTLRAGARFDHHSTNATSAVSPTASAAFLLRPSTQLSVQWGQYVQYPELNQFFSRYGRPTLLGERAIHTQLSVDQRLSSRTRLSAAFYNRADRDLLSRPLYDARIQNNRILLTNLAAPFANQLRGYARGVQFIAQRRSANGLSGWLSYNLNFSRLRNDTLRYHYPADYDQKHVANLFLSYRLRPTVNLSGRFTYASGFPVRGFYSGLSPNFFLAATPNQIRIPAFHRADFRANKTFVRKGWHLTLFVEVINLYNHGNVRFDDLRSLDTRTAAVRLGFEKMFPVIPSAGISLDW